MQVPLQLEQQMQQQPEQILGQIQGNELQFGQVNAEMMMQSGQLGQQPVYFEQQQVQQVQQQHVTTCSSAFMPLGTVENNTEDEIRAVEMMPEGPEKEEAFFKLQNVRTKYTSVNAVDGAREVSCADVIELDLCMDV